MTNLAYSIVMSNIFLLMLDTDIILTIQINAYILTHYL